MSDSISMGSVEGQLMSYIDTSMHRGGDYEIARVLLEHYREIPHLSIDQIAQLCYVSKASISRFCRALGYRNFKELRSQMAASFSLADDYTPSFLDGLATDTTSAMTEFLAEAQDNVKAVLDPNTIARLPAIAYALHDCRHAVFFAHHFLWDVGRHLQGKLMSLGRYMEVPLDYSAQLARAERLQQNDLAVICSIGGSYPFRYPSIANAIAACRCTLLVLTQNESVPFWNHATYLLRCGASNRNDTGKYGALALSDLIVLQYLRQYGGAARENDA